MNKFAWTFAIVTAVVGGAAVGRAAMSQAEIPKGKSPPIKEFTDKVVAVAATVGGAAYFITQLPTLWQEAQNLYAKVAP